MSTTDVLPAARQENAAAGSDPGDDPTSLTSFAALSQQLGTALRRLDGQSNSLQIPPLDGRDWFDLLIRKLLPQLTDDAYLIVAVVGGTNIGKSVVFNHIAGFRASSSSPLASGTKHPVCLIPSGFELQHDLKMLFPAFELRPWSDSDEALANHEEHCLFWRTSDKVPPNLVILDTPDVDSDAPVNWQRADAVRQAADVLVAVLTQQKYNDAAVKQFFRKAAAEDKAALIVFNQVELPDDEPYWPLWLQTFCNETGLQPEFVYLAPNDRKSAEAIRLKFEERDWAGRRPGLRPESSEEKVESRRTGHSIDSQRANGPPILNPTSDAHEPAVPEVESRKSGNSIDLQRANDTPILNPSCDADKPAVPDPSCDAREPAVPDPSCDADETRLCRAVELSRVLSQLRFAEIKLRTLRGSLKQLVSETDGAPAFLREIRDRSQQFRDAADVFAARSLVRHADWPAPPNSLLVDEMWRWWDQHREAWTSKVHGFYAHVGRWMTGGFRMVRERIWGTSAPPLDEYRKAEWDAIVRVLQQVYDQLRVVTTLGNELLTSRLDRLLTGTTCESVLERLRREHDEFDFDALVRELVATEMAALRSDRQHLFEILRNADRAAAVVRPVLTLLLAVGGGFGAEHMLMEAATQSFTHVAIDATAAAGTTVAGEAVVESATGVLGQAKAWLLQLHEKFKSRREAWLIAKLQEHLLGDLLSDLQHGATVPDSAAFREVERLIHQLNERLQA